MNELRTKTMTKAALVAEVAAQLGLPQIKAEDAVQAVLNELAEAFRAGQRVELRGFGVFKPRITKERMGRNPRTGVPAVITSRLAVKFSLSK
jgi:integration host factor subunit beta